MDEDTRTLKIEIPPCLVSSTTGLEWDDLSGLNGWQVLQGGLPQVLFWEGTIDLSGYAREMKTFFPSAAFIQEGPYWAMNATLPVTATGNMVATVVSSIPLEPLNLLTQLASNGGPGFLDLNLVPTGTAQEDWNTVLFSESQINLINQNIPSELGILQPLTNKQSGSISATASDTLYVMKIVTPFVAGGMIEERYIGNGMAIPASRVIIPGKFGTEPDVEYMMRLKRSVELSQQV
tara:strand:- start:1010 stop:1714 length:705 start_codon:yes stop_codon:yes gene_type:complete